jgi:hypothetical protein
MRLRDSDRPHRSHPKRRVHPTIVSPVEIVHRSLAIHSHAAEPPRDSFGSESFAGDYDLGPLFDALHKL